MKKILLMMTAAIIILTLSLEFSRRSALVQSSAAQMPSKLQITRTLIVAPWVFLALENEPTIYFFNETSNLPNILSYASEDGPPQGLVSFGNDESAALLVLVKEKVLFFPLSPSPSSTSNDSIVFQGQTIERIATSDQRIFLQLATSVGPVVAIFDAEKRTTGQFLIQGQLVSLVGLARGALAQTDSGVALFDDQGQEVSSLALADLRRVVLLDQRRRVALQQASTVTILDAVAGQNVGQITEDRPIDDIAAVADRIVLLLEDHIETFSSEGKKLLDLPLITKGQRLAVSQGRIYVQTGAAEISIFSLDTGQAVTEVKFDQPIESLLGFDERLLVFLRESDSKLIAYFVDEGGKPLIAFSVAFQ